ncbi:hypothetical protein AN219_37905 [Streptomyces nanshensis]|nr:hypothetical protein AN219_37905 [Streptomyces nanshensis]
MSPALRKRPEVAARAAAPAPRAEALARQLAQILPHVPRVRIRRPGLRTPWPQLELPATDENGATGRLNRIQALSAPRWVIRTHPGADGLLPHTVDLRTVLLGGGGA